MQEIGHIKRALLAPDYSVCWKEKVDNCDNRLEKLRQLNLEVRRRLELAEALIGVANAVLAQLAAAAELEAAVKS